MSKKPAPLTQGDVSGECVIYSALNAVRWLWPEHFGELEACEKLYGELVSRMEAEGIKEMLVEGTESDAALTVAWRMADMMAARGLHLNVAALERKDIPRIPFFSLSLRNALRRQHVADQGSVAIVGLDDPWDHWTVVTRATAATMSFFDSYKPERLKTLPWREFTLENNPGKIQIDASATVIYRRLDARIA